MASVSYPSRPALAVDAPDVEGFIGNFIYNFYVSDERVNDNGMQPPGTLQKSGATPTDLVIERLDTVARLVRLDWKPIKLTKNLEPTAVVFSENISNNVGFIQSNEERIYREEQFANSGYTGLQFQDTGVDGKMYLLASGSLSKLANSNNLSVSREINQLIDFVATEIDLNKISLTDAAKFLAGEIGAGDLPNQQIIDALTDLRTAQARFFSDDQTTQLIEDLYKRLKNVKTRVRINNKFIETVVSTVATDPLGFFADEIGPLVSKAGQIQEEILANAEPETIQEAEYDIIVEPVAQRILPSNTTFFPTRIHVGYIVDKFERSQNGELIKLDPIFIEDSNVTSIIDTRIAYGSTYVYQIRAIYLLDFPTFSDDDDELVISSILLSSAPSARQVLECVELIPPMPPADLNVAWDFIENAPVLTWCFPVNRQRDIVKWQIFKRTNIKEPFELLSEFDFDHSAVKSNSPETVDVNLIRRMSSPQNFYLDKNFEKDDKCIYSVCSIDAHGMSSNYSVQLEVTFDKFRNRIKKTLISQSGAPKPYPNMYLNSDTFVDTIRDSAHSKMRIYFDPEYLEIVTTGNADARLIGTLQNDTRYRMQFVNLDLQQSDSFDILIDDKRKNKLDKNIGGLQFGVFQKFDKGLKYTKKI